jgi:hypothetical protein
MTDFSLLESSSSYMRIEGSSFIEAYSEPSIQTETSNSEFNQIFNTHMLSNPVQNEIKNVREPPLAYGSQTSVPMFDMHGKILKVLEPGEKPKWQCVACCKAFVSKQSLERHKERHPLCKQWEEMPTKEETPKDSAYDWALKLIEDNLGTSDFPHNHQKRIKCKYCQIDFSNVGNLHKHFNRSVVCNKLAYKAIKEAFTAVKFDQA